MTKNKTITVFGANGHVGRLVVDTLIERGYAVRAFVHHPATERRENIHYIQGDVADNEKLAEAIKGSDAIISTLGSWGTKQKNILSMGMKGIVPQMERHSVRRIVSLTGADAWTSDQYGSNLFGMMNNRPAFVQVLSHRLFATIAGKIIEDGENHIHILQASSLDWTVIRSPVMNDRGRTNYSLTATYPFPWRTINRHAVALALVDELERDDNTRKAPYITRT